MLLAKLSSGGPMELAGDILDGILRSLRDRGFSSVQLVISDAPDGFKAAIVTVLADASWQRCRVDAGCAS